MSFTKVTNTGIGSTGTVLLQNLDVIGVTTVGGGVSAVNGFFSGITTFANATDSTSSTTGSVIVSGGVGIAGSLNVGGSVSVGGTLTYEDVTNIDSVGIITARSDILVGSGITLSPDGDGFFTGVVTATTFSGAFSGDGSALTGVANTDVIFPDKISLGDGTTTSGDQINVGLGSDLKIVHNDSDGSQIISVTTGLEIKDTGGFMRIRSDELKIQSASNETYIEADVNASVQIFHNNVKKLETATTGINPSADSTDDLGTDAVRWRNIYGDTLYGDGSNLTGIAAGITTEAASISGITTYLDLTKDDHELVVTGNNTISVIGGAQGASHTLRLQNSGIATVTLDSTYFKFPSGASPALPTASGSISLVSFTVHKAGAVGVNTVLLAGASVSFS